MENVVLMETGMISELLVVEVLRVISLVCLLAGQVKMFPFALVVECLAVRVLDLRIVNKVKISIANRGILHSLMIIKLVELGE